MLKRLYVDNLRTLVNFEMEFSELCLLLGPNGTGKSTLLDVLAGVRDLLNGKAKFADVFPSETLTRWQTRTLQVIELEFGLGEDCFVYRLELEHEPARRQVRASSETLRVAGKPLFEFRAGEVQLYKDSHEPGPKFRADCGESALARVAPAPSNHRLTRFLEAIRAAIIVSPYPRSFEGETVREDVDLARDGSNFASWYRHVVQERQDLIDGFHASVAKAIAGFHALRLEKVGSNARALTVVFKEGERRYELRFDELSDGERALIAIYAFVHLTAHQGRILFLDEPENYIALPEIQPWLQALDDACGTSIPQAVLCSHNAELIDYFGAQRSIWLERESSGHTVVGELPSGEGSSGLKLSELVARGWT